MKQEEKRNKDLKGWRLLIVAVLFYLTGMLVGGSESIVGSLLQITSYLFVLFSIVTGIRNLIRKSKSEK
jgi:hypothetical protein